MPGAQGAPILELRGLERTQRGKAATKGARPVPGRSGLAVKRSWGNLAVYLRAGVLRAGTARAPKSSRRAKILTDGSAKKWRLISLFKLYYLALERIAKNWTMPIHNRCAALNRFVIEFGDRVPALEAK